MQRYLRRLFRYGHRFRGDTLTNNKNVAGDEWIKKTCFSHRIYRIIFILFLYFELFCLLTIWMTACWEFFSNNTNVKDKLLLYTKPGSVFFDTSNDCRCQIPPAVYASTENTTVISVFIFYTWMQKTMAKMKAVFSVLFDNGTSDMPRSALLRNIRKTMALETKKVVG